MVKDGLKKLRIVLVWRVDVGQCNNFSIYFDITYNEPAFRVSEGTFRFKGKIVVD